MRGGEGHAEVRGVERGLRLGHHAVRHASQQRVPRSQAPCDHQRRRPAHTPPSAARSARAPPRAEGSHLAGSAGKPWPAASCRPALSPRK